MVEVAEAEISVEAWVDLAAEVVADQFTMVRETVDLVGAVEGSATSEMQISAGSAAASARMPAAVEVVAVLV